MNIREARVEDLDQILDIYTIAKKFMRETGNKNQWNSSYPDRDLLVNDIKKHQLYVMEEDTIHAVFAFIVGEDPTYKVIEGAWLEDSTYGTIHRIASDGKVHHIMEEAVDYCTTQCPHLRIDTHEDNKVMQKLILRNGFKKTGIIHIADGSPRVAFEKVSL